MCVCVCVCVQRRSVAGGGGGWGRRRVEKEGAWGPEMKGGGGQTRFGRGGGNLPPHVAPSPLSPSPCLDPAATAVKNIAHLVRTFCVEDFWGAARSGHGAGT